MPLIDFEGFPAGTRITTQFGDRGVVFPNGAFLDSDPNARSGSRVLRAGALSEEFHTGPMVMEFSSPQARVGFFAGGQSSELDGVARAFDSAGTLVAQDGPKSIAPNGYTTRFELSRPTAEISRLELDMEVTLIAVFEAIDDLEFEGEPPLPEQTTPPVVAITAPEDAVELDTDRITISGAVIGEGLFPRATIRIARASHPGSQAPATRFTTLLIGSGNTRTFAVETGIALGPHRVTAEAENISNLANSHTITFTNLPAAIRARFAADGGENTFGALQYGTLDGTARMAVYERGLIAARGGETFVVRGAILQKWLALTNDFDVPGRLGGPLAESATLASGGASQEFERGRIFADLPTGAHFVPKVFTDAIDALGEQASFGVPLTDPTDSIGAQRTWLFQRFTRPDQPQLLPSTLEIRGTPPVLYVERQGGDLSQFEGIPLAPRTPTIWQEFPCEGNLGPCPVNIPDPEPAIENSGARFCNNVAWDDFDPGDFFGGDLPPSWVPVTGQHDLTPLIGIVTDSHKAGSDNPLVHTHFGPPFDFPSDWNVKVRPHRGFEELFAENREKIGIEFEAYFAQMFFVLHGFPQVGDLLFTAGRWIIDCGHRPFQSEIHPPAVMAHIRNAADGSSRTEARIWVNGYYTGDPVEFELHPPPRPSPDANLTLQKPRDTDAALGLGVEHDFSPATAPGKVTVRFTASSRRPNVTSLGEMQWEHERRYYGQWDLFWSD